MNTNTWLDTDNLIINTNGCCVLNQVPCTTWSNCTDDNNNKCIIIFKQNQSHDFKLICYETYYHHKIKIVINEFLPRCNKSKISSNIFIFFSYLPLLYLFYRQNSHQRHSELIAWRPLRQQVIKPEIKKKLKHEIQDTLI